MYRMKNQSSICKQQAAQSMTSPLSRLPLPVQGVAFHIWISTYLTLNKQYVRLSRRATLTKTPKIHSIIEKLHFSATVKISNPRNILSPQSYRIYFNRRACSSTFRDPILEKFSNRYNSSSNDRNHFKSKLNPLYTQGP